jgi:hypothetical protein
MDAPQDKPKEKWFFKTQTVVMALLILGPLGLPLLWGHPRYRLRVKLFWTAVLVILTAITWKATAAAFHSIKCYYDQIFALGGPNA